MSLNNQEQYIFEKVVADVPKEGFKVHHENLVKNATANIPFVTKTFKDLDLDGSEHFPAVVISAGPGLHKFNSIQKIKDSGFKGKIIATDGSLIHCLKKGLIPDFVLSLDPHARRITRWFGDPNYEESMKGDDYFDRQDLDIEFRNNSIEQNRKHIELVNQFAPKIKLLLCSSAAQSVTTRVRQAGFDIYWWNPIVDNPNSPDSLTRKLYSLLKAPCMNTGGTVGTAAWVFAESYLKASKIAVVGMDLGYHQETPYNMTQTYYELIAHVGMENLDKCFQNFIFPLDGSACYTDPTYFWYRKNILELIEQSGRTFYNCTEGGTLFGKNVQCLTLEHFLKDVSHGQNSLH